MGTAVLAPPVQPEASSNTHPLRILSSSPPEASITKDRTDVLMAAFEEAIQRYRRENEDGPYEFQGKFSQAEFEHLDARCESKWRLGYNKIAYQVLLYGDPTAPHECTIASLRTAVQRDAASFFGQLAQTADADFNLFTPFDKVECLLQFSGGQSRDLGSRIKQADELLQLTGVKSGRVALAIEVAFGNESGKRVAAETLDWVQKGQAEFALGVKIKKNPDNQFDPFITVFFCDCRDVRCETSTSGVSATKPVVHEWPCGSGSVIAPQPGPKIKRRTLDKLNLQTASSPLNSNPAGVQYDQNFNAEIILHGKGSTDSEDTLQIALGRSWADEHRVLPNYADYPNFTAGDWEAIHRLTISIDLGRLRGEIIHYMQLWVEAGCPR